MKKNLLLILGGLLLVTSSAWALTPSLPVLKIQRLQKNLLLYKLTSRDLNLVQQLSQEGDKNHLVILDNKGDILATLKPHELAYQLLLTDKSASSVRLAESFAHSNQLIDLAQPLNLKNVPAYSIPSNYQVSNSLTAYLTPADIEVYTSVPSQTGACGGGESAPCKLYANGNQELPVFIYYNSMDLPTPIADFDPQDFNPANILFEDEHGNIIPINGECPNPASPTSMCVTTQPNIYKTGQITSGNALRYSTTSRRNSQNPTSRAINEFYAYIPKGKSISIHLNAELTIPGTKTTISSIYSSKKDVLINSIPVHPYTLNDFKFNLIPPQFAPNVDNTQIYTSGTIEVSDTLKNEADGLSIINYVCFSGQNSIDTAYPSFIGDLPGMQQTVLWKTTPGMKESASFYSDGLWNHLGVYLSSVAVPNPNNMNSMTLPMYSIFDANPLGNAVITHSEIAGTDWYGNPFDIKFVFKDLNGYLTEVGAW